MTTAIQVHTGEPPSALAALERPKLGLIRPLAQPDEIIRYQKVFGTLPSPALAVERSRSLRIR